MSIINCEDCDQPVSTSAQSCPQCGRPVTAGNLFTKDIGGLGALYVLFALGGLFLCFNGYLGVGIFLVLSGSALLSTRYFQWGRSRS